MSFHDLLSTSEFAEVAGLTTAEVRALISAGQLPAAEVGGNFVISLTQVEAEAPAIWERIENSAEEVDEADGSIDHEQDHEEDDDESDDESEADE